MLLIVEELTEHMGKSDTEDDPEREHLDGLEDGAGCVEIWEKLNEKRNEKLSDD